MEVIRHLYGEIYMSEATGRLPEDPLSRLRIILVLAVDRMCLFVMNNLPSIMIIYSCFLSFGNNNIIDSSPYHTLVLFSSKPSQLSSIVTLTHKGVEGFGWIDHSGDKPWVPSLPSQSLRVFFKMGRAYLVPESRCRPVNISIFSAQMSLPLCA